MHRISTPAWIVQNTIHIDIYRLQLGFSFISFQASSILMSTFFKHFYIERNMPSTVTTNEMYCFVHEKICEMVNFWADMFVSESSGSPVLSMSSNDSSGHR
ncbi:hypothetical protein KIN20_017946 [Parelaphostrongylus tenuis]|uniref:Uncharacterized protein n=1 Tax=Parelaphostrongylus tenuis TaxID=148309 RepID=A0AAD5MNY4_PARTN|nr:hypothetical protein KIN20_017946 [Parelaphostrongylus tenuis]